MRKERPNGTSPSRRRLIRTSGSFFRQQILLINTMTRYCLTAVLLITSLLLVARAEQPRFDEGTLAEIPKRMEQFVKEGQISGAVTLVATKDRVVHLAAVGKADLATGRPMEPDAIFRVASMTKPITATALMMLIEQGKLAVH